MKSPSNFESATFSQTWTLTSHFSAFEQARDIGTSWVVHHLILVIVNLQEFSRSLSQTSQHRQSRTKLLFIFFVWKRSIAVYWSLWLPLIIIYPHGLICCCWMIPSNILSVLPSTMTRLCCEFIICANPFIIWWWGHLIFTATPKKIEKLQVWKILQSFSLV